LAQSAHDRERLDAQIAIFVQNTAADLAMKPVGRWFLYGKQRRKLDSMEQGA